MRVGSFLNHQLDPQLLMHCAEEFARLFANQGVNKIVTIEASGIAPAIMVGYLMNLPVVWDSTGQSLMAHTYRVC